MDTAPDGSGQAQWRATVAARLPSQHWPQRTVLITAVEAHTGEPVVFDRHSGVDLVDAVAASTSNGFGVRAYRVGDGRYIDGGYRRNENADRAAGYKRCWCCHRSVADHGIRWRGACTLPRRSTNSARAAAESRRSSRTAAHSTFGADMMDLSARAPAARAGYHQGRGSGRAAC
jgi:NTE family protein